LADVAALFRVIASLVTSRAIGALPFTVEIAITCSHEDEKERLIPVEWGEIESLYPAVIHVEAWDRVGLVRDISAVVAGEKINITNMTVNENANGLTSLDFTLEIKGLDQLSRLLAKVEAIPGVTGAARVNHSLTPG